jgi:hypothetical protein
MRDDFKSWIQCVLALVALGAILMAVQQELSRRPRASVPGAASAPMQEAQTLTDPVPKVALTKAEATDTATPKESSSISAGADSAVPVSPTSASIPAQENIVVSTVSSQTIAPPLARAVKAVPNAVSVGGGSGKNETPTVDPPLAFIVDPKKLTPEQQTAVAAIQDQFLKAIGDANQDPADPVYGKRWMDAQSIADQSYKSSFGWTAFSQMQLERAMNSYTEIQPP